MTIIKEADPIESVADALQFISYYHPMDYIRALGKAYDAEKSPAAKDAIDQILTNSRRCADGLRPISPELGRAACRDRRGYDVQTSVVAGPLQTKYKSSIYQ